MRGVVHSELIAKWAQVTPAQRTWAKKLRILEQAGSDSLIYRRALNGFFVYVGDLEDKCTYYIKTPEGLEKPFVPKNLESAENLPYWATPNVLFDIVSAACTTNFNLNEFSQYSLRRRFLRQVKLAREQVYLSKNANDVCVALAEKFEVPEHQVLRWATGYYAAFMEALSQGNEVFLRTPKGKNCLLTFSHTNTEALTALRAGSVGHVFSF